MTNRYKILQYKSEHQSAWDAFIDQTANAPFLFKRDFMEYHRDRFEDHSMMVFDQKQKLAAIVPAHKIGTAVYAHKGLTYGGIVTKNNLNFNNYVHLIKALLKHLADRMIDALYLKVLPSIYRPNFSEEFYAIAPILKAKLTNREINLVREIEKKLPFSKLRNRGIKAGLKNNLRIEETADLNDFWNRVLIPNLREKHRTVPTHRLEEIAFLKKKFPKNIRQFNVYTEDKLIAGTTVFETEQTAHSQYISGLKHTNPLGGLDLLFDELINATYKDKKYFSFGVSTANEKNQINQGLFHWKEGFGTKPFVQDEFVIQTAQFSALEKLFL
jgi:hypothetical protein